MSIQYEIERIREQPAPLYHQYPNREEPQKAYLEMDSEGVVRVDWDPDPTNGDAIPMNVWNKGVLRWSLSPCADGKSLYEFLQSDRMRSLLERVHEGHSADRDSGELVGHLTEEAEAVSLQIQSILNNRPYMEREVYSRKDWVKSRFSVQDLIADGDIHSYIRDLYEEMDDAQEMEGVAFFATDGWIDEDVKDLCVDYVERAMEEGNEPDEAARKLAVILAVSGFDGYEDLPERYDARFSNALPFNRDGNFDDGVRASQRSEQAGTEIPQQE